MVLEGTVPTVEGGKVAIQADSVCLHGDGVHAIEFAEKIRVALKEKQIEIRSK